MEFPDRAIVVGFDGSAASENALVWAADEADRVGAPVHVVHVMHDPVYDGVIDKFIRDSLVESAQQALAQAETVRADRSGPYSAEWVPGSPAGMLVAASQRARLVVVGTRGHGGFTAALMGSVSQHLIRHAHGPVAVVRDVPETASRVVVGVDSAIPEPALSAAFEAAAARSLPLTVVHALQQRLPTAAPGSQDFPVAGIDADELEARQRAAIQDIANECAGRFPGVGVDVRFVREHPAHALVDASAESALTVVGTRGRGGFTGLLLGSTSSAVAAHAHGPVLVAR